MRSVDLLETCDSSRFEGLIKFINFDSMWNFSCCVVSCNVASSFDTLHTYSPTYITLPLLERSFSEVATIHTVFSVRGRLHTLKDAEGAALIGSTASDLPLVTSTSEGAGGHLSSFLLSAHSRGRTEESIWIT